MKLHYSKNGDRVIPPSREVPPLTRQVPPLIFLFFQDVSFFEAQIMKTDFMKSQVKNHQIMKSDFMKSQLKTTPDHEIRFHEITIGKTRS